MYINIFLVVILIVMMIRGFFRGFVKELLSLAGLIAAYLGAYFVVFHTKEIFSFFKNHHIYLSNSFVHANVARIIIFIGVFILIYIAFVIASIIITKILNLIMLGFLNRLGGFFFAGAKTVVFLSLIIFFLFSIFPVNEALKHYESRSALPYFFEFGKFLSAYAGSIWH